MPDATFANFMRRIRAGDEEAACALVRQYEAVVRLAVRVRLGDPGLGRLLDSVDNCQSVLRSFFVRAAAGQFDLDRPAALTKLLVAMARKKLLHHARRERCQRRDYRRRVADAERALAGAAAGAPPDRIAAGRELVREVLGRLTAEERGLAERRGRGDGWAEIAAELGGTPEARRKQLARALDRVTQQLGLDDTDHD